MLMGSSILFEETQFLGFLPLRSYFEARKEGLKGLEKCPGDKEIAVRDLIQRD
jgi:hypothetical protein